jgi:cell division protein FtsB
MDLLNILLSIIGFIGAISVGQLISIAKSLNQIKTSLEVLTTRHDYLENRVKDLENDYNNQKYTHKN